MACIVVGDLATLFKVVDLSVVKIEHGLLFLICRVFEVNERLARTCDKDRVAHLIKRVIRNLERAWVFTNDASLSNLLACNVSTVLPVPQDEVQLWLSSQCDYQPLVTRVECARQELLGCKKFRAFQYLGKCFFESLQLNIVNLEASSLAFN